MSTKTKWFSWKGVDEQGFCITGKTQAKNKEALKNILRQKNISILKSKSHFSSYFTSKITARDITLFAKEIAVLLNASIPLYYALQIIFKAAQKTHMQMMVSVMQKEVAQGKSFAATLKMYPTYFDTIFCSLIETGEQSGTLDRVLVHLIAYRENMQRLYQNICKALLYPVLVFLVALVVSAILLIAVIPQFVTIFNNVGATLPAFTQAVINISMHFASYGLFYWLGTALFILALKIAAQKSFVCKHWLNAQLLQIPWLGNFLKHLIFARCFRSLSMLLQAGLPLLDALQAIKNIAANIVFQQILNEITAKVRAGQSLYTAFSTYKIFSNRVHQMLHVGEESGCLENMLSNLATYFDGQVESQIQNLNQLLEPILMVFLSGIVGALVIAMYLPIFHLGSVV